MARPVGSKQKNKPLVGKAISSAYDTPRKTKLPTLKNAQGFEIVLTEQDLEGIEDMIAIGANAAYVAYQLGVCEAELNMGLKNFERLKQAIQRGLARDEMDIVTDLREQAKKGNITALIWYQKNKHGWRDNDAKAGNSVTIVNVSTGIDRGKPTQVIDTNEVINT